MSDKRLPRALPRVPARSLPRSATYLTRDDGKASAAVLYWVDGRVGLHTRWRDRGAAGLKSIFTQVSAAYFERNYSRALAQLQPQPLAA